MDFDSINSMFNIMIKDGMIYMTKYFFNEYIIGQKYGLDFNGAMIILEKALTNNLKEILYFLMDNILKLGLLNINSLFKFLELSFKDNNILLSKNVSMLIYKTNPNNDFTVPFVQAVELNLKEIVEFYIDNKYCVNFDDFCDEISEKNSINIDIFSLIIKSNINLQAKARIVKLINEKKLAKNKELLNYILKENLPIDNSLILAIKSNNFDLVESVLKQNNGLSYVNKVFKYGSALSIAVENNNLKVVKRLLSIQGIDPNVYSQNFQTPLVLAAGQLNEEIFNLIFDFYGENIKNQKDQLERSIKYIINNYNPEKIDQITNIISRIIKLNCIDPNLRFNKDTLLTFVIKINSIDNFKILFQNDSIDVNLNIPETGDTPLITAIKAKNNEITKHLIVSPKIDLNQKNYEGFYPLLFAGMSGQKDIFDFIFNNEKIDKNNIDINLIFYFSSGDITKELLSNEAIDVYFEPLNFNLEINKSPLKRAILNDDLEMLDLLIKHSSFKNRSQYIEITRFAIISSKIESFSKLFNFMENNDHININSPVFYEKNALFESIKNNSSTEMVSYILNYKGFDSNKSDIISAITNSCQNREGMDNINIIYDFDCNHDHLIDKEIGTKYKSNLFQVMSKSYLLKENNNYDPLRIAITKNSYLCALCLIDNNDSIQTTYIHLAAFYNRAKILEKMILKTLNNNGINEVDELQETPLMVACRRNNIECVELLFKYEQLKYDCLNENGEDAMSIVKKNYFSVLEKTKNIEPINLSNSVSTKDEYLNELLKMMSFIRKNTKIDLVTETQQKNRLSDSSKSDKKTKFSSDQNDESNSESDSYEEKQKKSSFSYKKSNQSDSESDHRYFKTENKQKEKIHFNKNDESSSESDKENYAKEKQTEQKKTKFSFNKSNRSDSDDNNSLTEQKQQKQMKTKFSFEKAKNLNFKFSSLKQANKEINNQSKAYNPNDKKSEVKSSENHPFASFTSKSIKVKLETYTESFSEEPDPNFQLQFNNLYKKNNSIENDNYLKDSDKLSEKNKERRFVRRETRREIGEDESFQSSFYQQQIYNQNQLMLLQQQQQQWYQMIQMNNELQSIFNMQMMNKTQIMRSHKKKKSSKH